MGRRSIVLAAGLWLAVVVVVSVATWTVIDAAGRDVTARPSIDPGAAGGATSTPSTTAASPRATPSRMPTAAPVPTTPDPGPRPQERTWAGSAGSVTARCAGGTISLVSATPADGWRMEVEDRGPGRVRVELRSGDDGEEREVEVRAECSGGVPGFRVDS
jgi:hypothetical protein